MVAFAVKWSCAKANADNSGSFSWVFPPLAALLLPHGRGPGLELWRYRYKYWTKLHLRIQRALFSEYLSHLEVYFIYFNDTALPVTECTWQLQCWWRCWEWRLSVFCLFLFYRSGKSQNHLQMQMIYAVSTTVASPCQNKLLLVPPKSRKQLLEQFSDEATRVLARFAGLWAILLPRPSGTEHAYCAATMIPCCLLSGSGASLG